MMIDHVTAGWGRSQKFTDRQEHTCKGIGARHTIFSIRQFIRFLLIYFDEYTSGQLHIVQSQILH